MFRVQKRKRLYIEINADEDGDEILRTAEVETLLTNSEPDTNDKEHFAIKFLYQNYKPPYWYWEVIEMYHKLLLTSVLPMFASRNRVVLGTGIIFSSFFTVLHAYIKPIKDSFEHCLQLSSLSVIPANFCIGFILEAIANESCGAFGKRSEQLGISVLLVVLNSLLIISLLARLVKWQMRKWSILVAERKCNCRCCIACVIPCVSGENINST